MDVWAAGALPSGLVVKSIHWLYRACPSGSSKSAITSFTWYSGTVCSRSRDLLTLASVNSVIFNGSHARTKGAHDYTRALTNIHDQRQCLLRDLGQKMNVLQINLVTSAFEYIRSLMNISNPWRRLLISISIAWCLLSPLRTPQWTTTKCLLRTYEERLRWFTATDQSYCTLTKNRYPDTFIKNSVRNDAY